MILDGKFYVPALRAKKGELFGLTMIRSDVASKVLPRLIVPPSSERNPDQDVLFGGVGFPAIAETLSDYWYGKSALVDPSHVLDEFGGAAMSTWFVNAIRHADAKGVQILPCIEFERLTGEVRAAFIKVVERTGREFGIAVSLTDMAEPEAISEFVAELSRAGIPINRCIVIADFKDADLSDVELAGAAIEDLLTDLISLAQWGGAVFQVSSYPSTNPAPKDGGSVKVPRNDWLVWQRLGQLSPGLRDRLRFGDYAADSSEISQSRARSGAIPHLRYATATDWLVVREKKGPNGRDRIAKVARVIVSAADEFSGSEFSPADLTIAGWAKGQRVNGAAWFWRALNTGRHISVVIGQIGADMGYEIARGEPLRVHEQVGLFPDT